MNLKIPLFFICIIYSKYSFAQEPRTVPFVDLNKYVGTWYEIASNKQNMTKECYCTEVKYSFSPKGYLVIMNSCNLENVNGYAKKSIGKAFVLQNSGNAKFKVQYYWPFKEDYWIVDLAQDYSYAVFSNPVKSKLRILSRTMTMDSLVYNELLNKLINGGFKTKKLHLTKQF